ncbi:hypothetical protein CAter10_4691 [Collimonas arenae]|nr:hypothetical protein CAter10_4691 [Collimonas arenae]
MVIDKKKIAVVLALTIAGASALADETIVFIRHGEKPEKGILLHSFFFCPPPDMISINQMTRQLF